MTGASGFELAGIRFRGVGGHSRTSIRTARRRSCRNISSRSRTRLRVSRAFGARAVPLDAAAAQAVASVGGQLEGFYFAFGDQDAYVIADLPDNETAAAIALTFNAAGAITAKTTVLLTPEQVDEAAKRSVDYRPPDLTAPGTRLSVGSRLARRAGVSGSSPQAPAADEHRVVSAGSGQAPALFGVAGVDSPTGETPDRRPTQARRSPSASQRRPGTCAARYRPDSARPSASAAS